MIFTSIAVSELAGKREMHRNLRNTEPMEEGSLSCQYYEVLGILEVVFKKEYL